jgi:hypothetical protein
MSNSLCEEFSIEESKKTITDIKERMKNAEQYSEPNDVLKLNIERAERLLDKIEEEAIEDFSPRLLEVAGKLIDCITTAANSLISNDVSLEVTNQKAQFLDLKKLELDFKKSKYEAKSIEGGNVSNTQNNIIVSDRESLLDFLKNENSEKILNKEI